MTKSRRLIDILCCNIIIGDEDVKASSPYSIVPSSQITFSEVYEVSIEESYKQLVSTATITFPRGSVYKKSVLHTTDSKGNDIEIKDIFQAELNGDTVIEKRSSQSAVDTTTFKIGQRISIQLGYNRNFKTMFDGYIASYGYAADGMIKLKCENMAYKLKLKQSPKIATSPKGTTIQEVLEGKHNILKGTGFKLNSKLSKENIRIGKIEVTDNFTVADILNAWADMGVYCFVEEDENKEGFRVPSLTILRPHSDRINKSKKMSEEGEIYPYPIKFDEMVANDGLEIMKSNPRFLAVTGKTLDSKTNKFTEVTIRLNPEYDPKKGDEKKYQTVNATQISKKTHKLTGNTTANGAKNKTKVDLSTYTVIPYQAPMNLKEDDLVKHCIQYFESYTHNGMTGDVTIFGDYGLHPAVQVEIIDKRSPEKNGVYIVEEVSTTFGTGGYRQKLKIPYKIDNKARNNGTK